MKWWLRGRLHISWLIAVGCLGVVVGVIAAQYIPPGSGGSVSWLCVGLLLAVWSGWRRQRYTVVVMCVAGLLLGLWRGSFVQAELAPYTTLIGHTVVIQGAVSEDADIGKDDELLLRLGSIMIEGHELPGRVWVSTKTTTDIKRGDIVTVRGKLGEGFGNFPASMYRASVEEVQRPQPGDVARQVRDDFADVIRKEIPEPQASLGIGYLVGQRRALPPELADALQVAGLTHIIVASGYNLTILVRLARRLFARVSKYLAALSAGGMILAFVGVTGMSPSMARAGLVAGLSLLAWYYGRRFHPFVLLVFAAAVTLLINPSYGWNDLGWQLSFAAFAGVMIVAPLAQRYLFGDKKPSTIRQIVGETIAAQIATLPLLVVAFGAVSNVALIANILILPLVPLAMLLTFVTGAGALVVPVVGDSVGMLATWLLTYMTETATYLAHLPWAQAEVAFGWGLIMLYYALLGGACWYVSRKTKYDMRSANIIE